MRVLDAINTVNGVRGLRNNLFIRSFNKVSQKQMVELEYLNVFFCGDYLSKICTDVVKVWRNV